MNRKFMFFYITMLILMLIMATLIVSIPSPVTSLVIDNDWIGFLGNLFGGFLGAITVIIMFYVGNNHDEESKINELKLFHKFLVETYFNNIMRVLKELKNQFINLLDEYEDNNGGSLLSFPHGGIPKLDYLEKVSELREYKIVSYEFESIYFEIQLGLENIESFKIQNAREREIYQRAYLDFEVNSACFGKRKITRTDDYEACMENFEEMVASGFVGMIVHIDKMIKKIEFMKEN